MMARSLGVFLLVPLLLGACASADPDRAFAPVADAARRHLDAELQRAGDDAALARIEARIAELLAEPLSAEAAVQVALLNHRGLQSAYAELGIAEAERVQALRWPNPGFAFGRLRRGDEREIERSLGLDLGHLLALPWSSAIEARRLEGLQRRVTARVIALAADTRKAHVRAVAAQQTLHYMQQVKDAADAGAELARRMAEAGNWTRLQRAREQAFFADAALNLARAQQAQVASRERLTRLLGLWGEQAAYRLPDRLPDLPPAPRDQPDVERLAMAQRLDVQAARAEIDASARQLGLTRANRFVNVFELGLMHNSSNEAPRQTGFEIGFEIPLFDFGDARVARAEAAYMGTVHRAAQTAVDARSEVREAYHAYRTAYDVARHYRDEVVPTARTIADENLLRYNGMLIGVFELLADARAQIASVNASIEALREHWLAAADLDMALLGPPRLDAAASATVSTGDAGAAH